MLPPFFPSQSIQHSMYYRTVTITAAPTHTAAVARLGHALSDPTRTGILLALRGAPGYPSDLAEDLGVSRQAMSNHLACLRGCGLVTSSSEGRRARYRLADSHLSSALDDLMRVTLIVEPGCCDGTGCTC